MKPALLLLALGAPLLAAAVPSPADAPWLAAAVEQSHGIVSAWQKETRNIDDEFALLEVDYPTYDAAAVDDLPDSPNGDTVAVCEGGLLFDALHYDLVYLHHVRLRDDRLHLRARNRLFLRLQERKVENSRDELEQQAQKAAVSGAHPGLLEKSVGNGCAESCTETVSPAPVIAEEPLEIRTFDAVADAQNNCIILYAPAGKGGISLDNGKNHLRVAEVAEGAAMVLADGDGNILLQGGALDMEWTDDHGGVTRLHSMGGLAYYRAADSTLVLPGAVELARPDGTFSCTDSLVLRLEQGEKPVEPKKGFMQQFAQLHPTGVAALTARGQVRLHRVAENREQTLEGDALSFNAETGECRLSGTLCRLKDGAYMLESDKGIELKPNGDLTLLGHTPRGAYERASQKKENAPLCGTFEAFAPLHFCAETRTVSTASGFRMSDAEADFSCTGAVEVQLSARGEAPDLGEMAGKLNLAVAACGEPETLHVAGAVTARLKDAATGAVTGYLTGETLTADLRTGAALLAGTAERNAVAEMDGNHLEATAGGEVVVPSLQISENGDVTLNGDSIETTLKTGQGTATAHCRTMLKLVRETDTLETGSGAEFVSDEARVMTNGPLFAHLVREAEMPADETRPAAEQEHRAKFAQLRFNYKGIESARTEQGGTVQTTKGSMQCTGLMSLTMDPDAKDSKMAGVKTAQATGNVAVAGKDGSGRLIRATGDVLTLDAATGMKVLTGSRVTLSDAYNTHIASGAGAAVRIDEKNNARITGASHSTTATHLQEQINKQQKKKD